MRNDKYWQGEFGNSYVQRNCDQKIIENNKNLFEKIGYDFDNKLMLEIGCGAGFNLKAIKTLNPNVSGYAVEINKQAYDLACTLNPYFAIANIGFEEYAQSGILTPGACDIVLTKGFLIHVNPHDINSVYDKMVSVVKQGGYILICEYFNPEPVEVKYHGYSDILWKRDFFMEMKKRHLNLSLVRYGFVYHQDEYPQDNLTWFLIQKT